jgi:hypothetical protein
MPQKVNYYAVLSRAVATLDRDAFGARGAVYDREHRVLLRRLALANPPCSEEDVAAEEQAFRDAIRRIEFPDHVPPPRPARADAAQPRREFEPGREPPAPRPEPPRDLNQSRAEPRESLRERPSPRLREPAGRLDREPPPRLDREPANRFEREPRWRRDEADEENARDLRGSRLDPPGRAAAPVPPYAAPQAEEEDYSAGELEADERAARPSSVVRRIVFATQITTLAVGIGLLGYITYPYWRPTIDLSGVFASAPSSQRAALYPAGQANATPVLGKATWRTRTDSSSGTPATVVVLEAEIPERQIALTMTIAREAEGGGMSHMFELQFAHPDTLPFDGITAVPKIVMKDLETGLGDDLLGTSITVSPGSYLFGLLSTPEALARNVEAMRTRAWMGILINFGDGSAQTLNVEKGASGQRVMNEALAKWGQGQNQKSE